MRFAVICIKKNNNFTVVASGDYSELSVIYDEIKEEYSNDEDTTIKLIDFQKDYYEKVKDNVIELNKLLRNYFESDLDDIFDADDMNF